jgi:hypothetical protein
VDGLGHKLDQTILQEEDVPGFDDAGQPLELHRDTILIAEYPLRGQNERRILGEVQRFDRELPDADLRSGEISHDGDPPTYGLGGRPQTADERLMRAEVPVGEVETGHVHAGADEVLHHGLPARRRADGADDLGLVRSQTHGPPPTW